MEVKKAAEVLEIEKSVAELELSNGYGNENFRNFIEAANIAIGALEKQVPKKPIKNREQLIRYTSCYSCPACDGGFTGTGFVDYCYHCGQKLDWGDE